VNVVMFRITKKQWDKIWREVYPNTARLHPGMLKIHDIAWHKSVEKAG